MDVKNLTQRPLTISLPGGKKLRLGPGKTGQIGRNLANHPVVTKLVEAGTIELARGGASGTNRSGGGSGGVQASTRRGSGGTPRQTGDR